MLTKVTVRVSHPSKYLAVCTLQAADDSGDSNRGLRPMRVESDRSANVAKKGPARGRKRSRSCGMVFACFAKLPLISFLIL